MTFKMRSNSLITGVLRLHIGFPGGSVIKESPCNAGDLGSVPGSGRHPRGGNGNPLQHSGQENSINREAWQATVHGGCKGSDATEQLSLTYLCKILAPQSGIKPMPLHSKVDS